MKSLTAITLAAGLCAASILPAAAQVDLPMPVNGAGIPASGAAASAQGPATCALPLIGTPGATINAITQSANDCTSIGGTLHTLN